jgi:hypothetical protein
MGSHWQFSMVRGYPFSPGLLRELRRQPSEKRPKLGAYQRWVRELDVAEGDPQEPLGTVRTMRRWCPFGERGEVENRHGYHG